MKKLKYKGEIYYYYNDNIVDSTFIEIPISLKTEIARKLFSRPEYNYKNYDEEKIIDFAKKTKNIGLYSLSIEVCLYGMKTFGNKYNLVYKLLPVLTSNYRVCGEPEKAINIFNECVLHSFGYISTATLTSIAASYCDIKDYDNARKYAGMAYARQGGGVGYKNELSLVYKRIEKETNDNTFNK